MKPLIIQSDMTLVLETTHPLFEEVKNEVIKFSEIVQSLEALYIFKLTDISIWSALAIDLNKDQIIQTLKAYSKFDLPKEVISNIDDWSSAYGAVVLLPHNDTHHILKVNNSKNRIKVIDQCKGFITEDLLVPVHFRGEIKSLLMKEGLPVKDEVGYTTGQPLLFDLIKGIDNRFYQVESAQAVYQSGNGTVILPCGSGKTAVGIRFATLCKTHTLIVTNSSASVKQWKQSLLKFTDLKEEDIAIYAGKTKEIKPVTILTYNMASYKHKGVFKHFNKLLEKNWGCLILDEVHLMPAKMFRIISSIQSIKRLALTATFVREDGREKDIFTLIGPKRYEKPWKDLEALGYIANIELHEVRVKMTTEDRDKYSKASNKQEKFIIASTAPSKLETIKKLMEMHKDENILIIGQFPEHLEELGKQLGLPVVHGKTSDLDREAVYDAVREGKQNAFIASKVANAALDIPNLNVLIQVSFQYSSRNEEAQRQGRITRPSEKVGKSYTVICEDTVEVSYNRNRMIFLTSEGYSYKTIRI